MTKSEANEFEGDFQARGLELKEDFAFDYRIDVPESALSWIAYRAPGTDFRLRPQRPGPRGAQS